MTAKKTIFIDSPHTVFGNNAQPLSPGFEYEVKDTPKIQQLIDDGLAVEVSAPAEESRSSNKTKKDQDTDSSATPGEL